MYFKKTLIAKYLFPELKVKTFYFSGGEALLEENVKIALQDFTVSIKSNKGNKNEYFTFYVPFESYTLHPALSG